MAAMEIRLDFARLLAYDRWANGEALASLEALPAPPPKAVETMGHVMGAEIGWLLRMTEGRDPEDWETWEKADLPWLRNAWREVLPARWSAFLADPARSEPGRSFRYLNFLGDRCEFPAVGDASLGLLFHSEHHRGQVASLVRAAGGKPAVTDYIAAVRKGITA